MLEPQSWLTLQAYQIRSRSNSRRRPVPARTGGSPSISVATEPSLTAARTAVEEGLAAQPPLRRIPTATDSAAASNRKTDSVDTGDRRVSGGRSARPATGATAGGALERPVAVESKRRAVSVSAIFSITALTACVASTPSAPLGRKRITIRC